MNTVQNHILLTEDKIRLLEKPFTLDDHDWLQGSPYLYKDAIRRRLTQADPHWSITPPELVIVQGDLVVMSAVLTVCGSSRGSIGTGVIQHAAVDEKTGEISAFNEAKLLAKAYKTADRDTLPRCAEQFNVGWYLKSLSKDLKKQIASQDGLRRYLDSLNPPSAHWGANGGALEFNAKVKEYNLQIEYVLSALEPERKLQRVSDISLTKAEAFARLEALAAQARQEGVERG